MAGDVDLRTERGSCLGKEAALDENERWTRCTSTRKTHASCFTNRTRGGPWRGGHAARVEGAEVQNREAAAVHAAARGAWLLLLRLWYARASFQVPR